MTNCTCERQPDPGLEAFKEYIREETDNGRTHHRIPKQPRG